MVALHARARTQIHVFDLSSAFRTRYLYHGNIFGSIVISLVDLMARAILQGSVSYPASCLEAKKASWGPLRLFAMHFMQPSKHKKQQANRPNEVILLEKTVNNIPDIFERVPESHRTGFMGYPLDAAGNQSNQGFLVWILVLHFAVFKAQQVVGKQID